MGKKIFTIDEVEQLIPQLEYHFRQLWVFKREMARCSMRLKKMGIMVDLMTEDIQGLSSDATEIYQQLKAHYLSFKKHLLAIEAIGGEVKDLELGRVDFAFREGDQETTLTWQMGVTEPFYRHPKD